jgi:glutaredoxin 3
MTNIIIYSAQNCGYCTRAKELLTHKGVSYTEIRIDLDPAKREEMLQRANGKRTVPQIFINDQHIGGYDDLAALELSGKLDALLAN